MKTAASLLLVVCLLPIATFAQAMVYDFSKLYETASPAIVQVTTEDGMGSGFLVTSFGHIATNYHVIRGARYLAVQFPGGRKVKAIVVAANPRFDMAILKVNSDVVENIQPLPVLAVENETSIKVGIPVAAIGSPLNQKFLMTQGILSKVDETTVLGDFLLQPGNSGGPLMNFKGEVIAMNTFGEGEIAGAVRIAALRDYLSTPELIGESMEIQPPADQLRSVSSVRYPVDVLNHKIETEPLDMEAYKFKAGDFKVTVVTPVLLAKLQVMREKHRAANRLQRRGNIPNTDQSIQDSFYEWHRSTETSLDYAVTFDVQPDSGPTKGSGSGHLIPPILRFGKTGKNEMEFKGEFLDFRLYRDGALLEPITPGRYVVEGSTEQKNQRFVDQAYAGSYVYSPEEFLTGNEFRIQIVDARNPNQIHKELVFTAESRLIKQLRTDFTFAADLLITQVPSH